MARPLTFVAPNARVSDSVQMAEETSIWFGAIVSGEVVLEAQANIQDNSIVEGSADRPVVIGAGTTLGHNARVYGATIEPRSLIAIGATVQRGATIGSQSIVAANATVPEDMHVPPRSLVIGHGRILRPVSDEEIARIDRGARDYVRLTREYASATR